MVVTSVVTVPNLSRPDPLVPHRAKEGIQNQAFRIIRAKVRTHFQPSHEPVPNPPGRVPSIQPRLYLGGGSGELQLLSIGKYPTFLLSDFSPPSRTQPLFVVP